MIEYIAFLEGIRSDGKSIVPMSRLEYAFHTFSLKDELAYEPTGDVLFASPNPDARALDGGVERLIDAVLGVQVRAHVLTVEALKEFLDNNTGAESIEVAPGVRRTVADLEALYVLTQSPHEHKD